MNKIVDLLKIIIKWPVHRGLLASVLLMAVASFVFINISKPAQHSSAPRPQLTKDIGRIPLTQVPAVEPIAYLAIGRAAAQAINASAPFSSVVNSPARPFKFSGDVEDRARAEACLASAVLYEAGDDLTGQRAVAQVVLNRVRHPAFPKTVCGVVFQGSERRTGCQFTFTCDGALNRSYPEPVWKKASLIAAAALSGSVYQPVGEATHYHTDWVVPYWSASLDKIAAVETHLFYRWKGWWGTPAAFRFNATGLEPRIKQLALRFPEHRVSNEIITSNEPTLATMAAPVVLDPSLKTDLLFIHLPSRNSADFPAIAGQVCGGRPYCRIRGWVSADMVPTDTTATLSEAQLDAMSFSYLRDRVHGFERNLWNCRDFKRPKSECMWSSTSPVVATWSATSHANSAHNAQPSETALASSPGRLLPASPQGKAILDHQATTP